MRRRVRQPSTFSLSQSECRAERPFAAVALWKGTPPLIQWADAPAATKEFVIVCEDPDAPSPRPFVHWVVVDACPLLDTASTTTTSRSSRSTEPLALEPGADLDTIVAAMKGHVLASGDVMKPEKGTAGRNGVTSWRAET